MYWIYVHAVIDGNLGGKVNVTMITANEREFARLAALHPFSWRVVETALP